MKRFLVLLAGFSLMALQPAFAQKKNKKDKNKEIPSTPPPGVNLNFLPLFGGYVTTEKPREEDSKFLADCAASFKDQAEASQFFENRAWEYMQEGQLDTASYRFNLAWLLNPNNVNTYWGLGIIESQRGKNPEGIRLLEKGLQVQPTNGDLLVDLGALRIQQFINTKEKKELEQGMAVLTRAIAADTANASAYSKLAYGYFLQEDYDKAWENVHKGRALNIASVDYQLLPQLIAKKPDPQGFFKEATVKE